jgi:uncharacterized protein with HEPN domain
MEMTERFGDSIDAFKADNAYRHACTMCILQIGELSTHLTDDFKLMYDEMPWKKIKAMRNIFAHTYDEMSLEQTWNTVKKSIPELAGFCERIIEQYNILEQPAVEIEYDQDIEMEDQFENEDELE